MIVSNNFHITLKFDIFSFELMDFSIGLLFSNFKFLNFICQTCYFVFHIIKILSNWKPNFLPIVVRLILIYHFLLWCLLLWRRLQNTWFWLLLHKFFKFLHWLRRLICLGFLFNVSRTLLSNSKLNLSQQVLRYSVIKLFCFCGHLLTERT